MKNNAGNAVRIAPLSPPHADQSDAIARALPAWFGIVEGLQDLRRCAETQPGFVALHGNHLTGFVTLDQPFPETWEITWMAVAPDRHRQGVGRALIDAVITDARRAAVARQDPRRHPPEPGIRPNPRLLPGSGIRTTDRAPRSLGPENPCLLMVRPL